MRLKVHHRTVYDYPQPVINSVNEARLRPLNDDRQSCLSFQLTTSPRTDVHPYEDYFGNTVHYFDIQQPHRRLEVIADAEVMTEDVDSGAKLFSDYSPYGPVNESDRDRWIDFLTETPVTVAGPLIRAFAESLATGYFTVSDCVRAVADRVHDTLKYEAGVTAVDTTAEAAMALGAGVCQDFTHVYLSVCRRLGIPARYVSGYLCIGAGADQQQASHAWPEVLLPMQGWVGLDVANGRFVDSRYVRVAVGRDYGDVPPIRGAYSGPPGAAPMVAVYVYDDAQQ